MDIAQLRQKHTEWLEEGSRMAGALTALSQRATTYHHLFRDSGGNHVFPLIAAHGALWARGYFAFGMKLGRCLSWQFLFDPVQRRRQLASLDEFADAFRDVNRRVCADTYANYHFTAQFGEHADAGAIIDPQLLEALNRVHAARRAGRTMSDAEKRMVFETHFLHEQSHVVGPSLEAAVNAFQWPLLKAIALRPLIQFSFFRRQEFFWFRNFANREERIQKGLQAFEIAATVGWENVAAMLKNYDILPEAFFADSRQYFNELRTQLRPALSAS